MSLCTSANVKLWLSINDTNHDTIIAALILSVDSFVNMYCNRTIEAASYTHYFDGNGSKEMFLPEYPINSITSIHDDTERAFGAAALIASTDYVFYKESGRVVLFQGGYFTEGFQNIKVVYNAGYSSVPAAIEQAAKEIVAYMFKIGKTKMRTVSVEEEVQQFLDENDHVRRILDSYRKPAGMVPGV